MMKHSQYPLLFCTLLVLVGFHQTSHAQTNTQNDGIFSMLKKGEVNTDSVTKFLNEQTGAATDDTADLISQLQGTDKISTSAGDKLLESIATGELAGKVDQIKGITDAVEAIRNGDIDAAGATKLVESIAEGKIPSDVAKVLSGFEQLEALSDIGSIEDLFQNPEILQAITDRLNVDALPQGAQDLIANITELAAGLGNISELGVDAVADAITGALPTNITLDLGGGLTLDLNLTSLFDSVLSTSGLGSLGGSVGPAGTTASGSYEITEADPKSDPVNDGSCSLSCASEQDCTCKPVIEGHHATIRLRMTNQFITHRTWMIDVFYAEHILPALAQMTSQFTTLSMQQVQIIGGFFDAKHQLETQRIFQQLMAEAHKDYQPSEGLCEIGTNVRSLAASDAKSKVAHMTFANRIMARQLRNSDTTAGNGADADINSRIVKFKSTHCRPSDNSNGLNFLCTHGGNIGAVDKKRYNRDVDYAQNIEQKLTLDIDFSSNAAATEITADEEDVFALTANLFAHTPLDGISGELLAADENNPRAMAYRYMDTRSIAAKRSVAQNAFTSIIAERTEGEPQVGRFLKRIVAELGVPEDEVDFILGNNPSYFAQMEVLTKDLYQNPVFYTELYDKPANVLRKGAAIRAIRLMQERDIYERQLQSEMIFATKLGIMLNDEHKRLEGRFITLQQGGN